MNDRATTVARSRSARGEPQPRDFIRAIVDRHVAEGRYPGVVTRFPPEPNGFLHIGHVKSIALNFGIAREFGGRCHLRFDDTNPETENETYVRAIQEDVRWLGYDWGTHLYYAADYFERMYEIAERLIQKGKAYVDSSTEEEIREARGTLTQPGRPTKYRSRTVEENLDLFRRMRAGEFPDGAHVLRAKIDLSSPNMVMRDPALYRIRHAHHYRTGDQWCIYPLYDYAHCLEDAFEGITHSICTLEFEINRELYDWVLDEAGFAEPRTHQYEFARLNLEYTILSKRRLIRLVEGGFVSGWDDPRMSTVAGYRRRGVPPAALRAFCDMIGVTKAETRVDLEKLDYAIRDELNMTAPRVMGVLRPLRLVVTSWPEGKEEWLDAASFPADVGREGSRKVPFTRELWIERDDFAVEPPKGWKRLAPGREVRLKYGHIARYEGHDIDPATGEVTEVRVTHEVSSRSVPGTIHWVPAGHAVVAEVRLYDRLFTVPDPDDVPEGVDFTVNLNPDSLVVIPDARLEPSVRDAAVGTRWQLERTGFFWPDPVDSKPGKLVLNRIVTLRDGWAKKVEAGASAAPAADPGVKKAQTPVPEASGPDRGRETRDATRKADPDLAARMRRYRDELALEEHEADLLTGDRALADFFEGALAVHPSGAGTLASWVINDLPREARGRAFGDLPFGPSELGRLVALVAEGAVSRVAAKEVLAELATGGGDPAAIVDRRGLRQVADRGALLAIADRVLAEWPAKVAEYRSGKAGLLGFFVGQVVRASGGSADPKAAKAILEERLS